MTEQSPAAPLTVRVEQARPFALQAAFDCPPGQVTALFGPSGSGKTTLLRTIAGLHRPAAGRVTSGEQVWLDTGQNICLPPEQRSVGLVFQDFALFPHFSVARNLLAAMGHLPTSQRGARVAQLLALLGLTSLADRRPARLSGGQQQRVAIGRALARDPRVLLLDEPFAALDRGLRRVLHGELAALRAGLGLPIVLVTHDYGDVAALADRLVVLRAGQVLATGPVTSLATDPGLSALVPGLEPGTVLDGIISRHQEADGLTLVSAGGLELRVPRLPAATGAAVRLQIPAREVILATSQPGAVSLHNVLPMTVARITPDERGTLCLVSLVAGDTTLLAQVTCHAVAHLAIAPGQEVFALFKALAVDVSGTATTTAPAATETAA